MSTNETLYIDTEHSCEEALTMFLGGLGIVPKIEHHAYIKKIWESAKGPGFDADVAKLVFPTPHHADHLTRKLGFLPSIRIALFYDKVAPFEETRTILMRATLELVYRTQWNIALKFQYGDLVLLHKDKVLTISTQESIWTPERLNLLKMPYVREKIQTR